MGSPYVFPLRRDPRPVDLYGDEGLGVVDVVWAEEDLADWTKRIVTTDGSNAGELQVVGGRGRGAHTLGLASGVSNLRQVFTRRGTNYGAAEIRGLWYGGPGFNSTMRPQHGFILGLARRGDVWSCVIMWHDVAFGVPWVINIGVWQWGVDPADLDLRAGNFLSAGLPKSVAFTDASRTSNVVTATGAASGHGLAAGDRVTADFADNTYDGRFALASAGATSVTWPQTASNDASAGAGTLVRTYPHMAAFRRNGPLLSGKVWPVSMPEEPDWADTAYALTVDLRTLGSAGDRLAIPTPEGSGLAGILQGHTAQDSWTEYGALRVTQFAQTAF